ncbi:MAG TPA: DUF5695 domain-containing protein [Vicinamibacterales bacterium]|nr:DUF5695 domain-containing protein [Vicinamibacterales bacterium]
MKPLVAIGATALLVCALAAPPLAGRQAGRVAGAPTPDVVTKGDFRFAYDERGISSLANPNDPFGATLTTGAPAGRRGGGAAASATGAATLGLTVVYRAAGQTDWTTVANRAARLTASPDTGTVTYTSANAASPLKITETYHTDGRVLDWTIDLESTGRAAVTIGDLGISIPAQGASGATPADIFERGFLKHQFVSGYGSFFFYVRASGAPPFLLVTVRPGTKLEYTATGGGRGGGPQVYVHSSHAAAAEPRGSWRQPNTSLDLAPAGQPGSRASYGFRLQWASSYDELRDLIYQAGLFDVRVVPGMTVPSDLTARFSLHTKAKIERIEPEFPADTTMTILGAPRVPPVPDTHVYEVAFRKLGENELTIVHDGGRRTYLEFFVTEPMETLIKKRAAFLVNRQQIKDPSKWWNGVYAIYDMRAKTVRTIDDPDIFLDRMVYALTCDDPGLSKAPYLAEKNVTYPDRKEIESLEYYLKNFVWGGLQRRDDERPYPYGVYGTPNWFINRDPARRKDYAEHLASGATALRDLDKEHVWRSYDYPHVIMLYFHMYQIAKLYPEMSTYLDAAGYLNRAWETARAFYIYPYEIYPSYYETYKWGLYNELVVLDLIAALDREGFPEQAGWLRHQWEIKTKYFVYDDPYPFRSEYAFDRTAFESTYAFAKYGATHDMAPDEHLWYDVKLQKWYSHPSVAREDSRAFMDRQLASGLVVRGWLNPAYYTLGSDAGMSYMAAMGGWGVLDYGLNFAPRPFDWLQLGYASYLSSWALMNTGRPETNYGFWSPGPENDGAAGWQFMSTKVGSAWMGSSYPGGVTEPRGPWHYDGEIDLGFGGALRMAATVVTNDPIFGWFAYGGVMTDAGTTLTVVPRDGLRRRLDIVIPDRTLPFPEDISRVKLELERDGFAEGGPITLDKAASRITFAVENRTGNAHATGVRLALPANARFELRQDGKTVALVQTGEWDYPWRAQLAIAGGTTTVELIRR